MENIAYICICIFYQKHTMATMSPINHSKVQFLVFPLPFPNLFQQGAFSECSVNLPQNLSPLLPTFLTCSIPWSASSVPCRTLSSHRNCIFAKVACEIRDCNRLPTGPTSFFPAWSHDLYCCYPSLFAKHSMHSELAVS